MYRALLFAGVECGVRVRSFERVVILVVNAEEMPSAAREASSVICLISSSAVSVFGAVALRLRDVGRWVGGGNGESGVAFDEDGVEVGVCVVC